MDALTNFLANNYVWFLIISLILIFALIGYLVDVKEIKNGKRKKKEEIKVVDFSTIDQSKSLNESIKEETNTLNLDQYVNKSKEEKNVENLELESINLENSEMLDLDEGNELILENEFKQDVKE